MDNWYPDKLVVGSKGTPSTLKHVLGAFGTDTAFHYAEFGIYEASTAFSILDACPQARVSLFDFDHTIEKARQRLAAFGDRVKYYGNTQRHLDSYNWPLALLIRDNPGPIFDYVFLDGAHTYAVDALTFFLCDRLLKVGGYADFDDYGWRLARVLHRPDQSPCDRGTIHRRTDRRLSGQDDRRRSGQTRSAIRGSQAQQGVPQDRLAFFVEEIIDRLRQRR